LDKLSNLNVNKSPELDRPYDTSRVGHDTVVPLYAWY